MGRRRYVPKNPPQVRAQQVTEENVRELLHWIAAGKIYYRPAAPGWRDGAEYGGITLFTERGHQVARFGDWIVRTGESGWSVVKAEDFAGEYLEVPIGEAEEHCCEKVYFCPAAGETECPDHSGFDRCCDNPGRHRPVAIVGEGEQRCV